jgi:Serine/threonine protein phosphatase
VVTPLPGDRFLLCSDGLSDYVDDQQIADALAQYPDLERCARRLIDLALDAGAPDNVSVVVADVVADPSDG